MGILKLLKKIPIDFAQESVAEKTKGKTIAKSLVPEVKKKDSKKALDVGCRKGVQSKWLESRGYNVTSIDIEKDYKKCKIVDANKKLPFKKDSFDLIWCSEVIEHLKDPKKSINEFIRVTKKKGDIIMTTPNSYFWLFRLFSLFGIPPKKLQRDDHLHFFHIRDIEKICPDAELYGFFPYILIKFTVRSRWMINLLSPTFVIHIKK